MNNSSFWSLGYLMGRWHPTIGDPSFVGWFTVVSYLACALFAGFSARTHQKADHRSFYFWSLVALLMLLLGINKQLDLQSLLTEMGRQVARYQGWMEERRVVQLWFIAGFSTILMAGFVCFCIIMRNLFRRFMLAFMGLFLLLGFIIIRAASFHHIDEVLHSRIWDLKMNWIFELGGIFIVWVAAAIDMRRPGKIRKQENLQT
jgi:ATP/ADP translocase